MKAIQWSTMTWVINFVASDEHTTAISGNSKQSKQYRPRAEQCCNTRLELSHYIMKFHKCTTTTFLTIFIFSPTYIVDHVRHWNEFSLFFFSNSPWLSYQFLVMTPIPHSSSPELNWMRHDMYIRAGLFQHLLRMQTIIIPSWITK